MKGRHRMLVRFVLSVSARALAIAALVSLASLTSLAGIADLVRGQGDDRGRLIGWQHVASSPDTYRRAEAIRISNDHRAGPRYLVAVLGWRQRR